LQPMAVSTTALVCALAFGVAGADQHGSWTGSNSWKGSGSMESGYNAEEATESPQQHTSSSWTGYDAEEVPVDCVGSWGEWGACSVTCGGGKQTRAYSVTTEAEDGAPCAASDGATQEQVCSPADCPEEEPEAPAPEPEPEPPVDCVGNWGDWGTCSRTCGTGSQSRTLSVTTQAAYDGVCVTTENRACATDACTTPQPVVKATTTVKGAVSADSFIDNLASAIEGVAAEDIEITSYTMEVSSSATVDFDCDAQEAFKAQYILGLKDATGQDSIEMDEANSDYSVCGGSGRRLQDGTATLAYKITITDAAEAATVAAQVSDETAFAAALDTAVNAVSPSDLAAALSVDVSTVTVKTIPAITASTPVIETAIEYTVTVPTGVTTAAIAATAEDPTAMLSVVQSSAVSGTDAITEAPVATATETTTTTITEVIPATVEEATVEEADDGIGAGIIVLIIVLAVSVPVGIFFFWKLKNKSTIYKDADGAGKP